MEKEEKTEQPKHPNELIGRKVKGFRFESIKGCTFTPEMESLIDELGRIISYRNLKYTINFKKNNFNWEYPADQIEQHLLPENKTKKERIEELEKRVEQLENKRNLEDSKSMDIEKDYFPNLSKKYPLWNFFKNEHNLTLLDSEIDDVIHEVNKYQNLKQAPEFWYVDIVEEKDSELLPTFNEWYLKILGKEELYFNWNFLGYSGINKYFGYDFEDEIEDFHNSDKMQKITLNEWNNWFNK